KAWGLPEVLHSVSAGRFTRVFFITYPKLKVVAKGHVYCKENPRTAQHFYTVVSLYLLSLFFPTANDLYRSSKGRLIVAVRSSRDPQGSFLCQTVCEEVHFI